MSRDTIITTSKELIRLCDGNVKYAVLFKFMLDKQYSVTDYSEYDTEECEKSISRKIRKEDSKEYGWFYLDYEEVREHLTEAYTDKVIRTFLNEVLVKKGFANTKKGDNPFDRRKMYRLQDNFIFDEKIKTRKK